MNEIYKLYGSFSVCLFKAIMNNMAVTFNVLVVTVFYMTILFMIIVVDLRRRRILNVIVLPAITLTILYSLTQGTRSFYLTVLGALTGYLFFYLLYWLGKRLYGPGALGFGDVKLAMLLGAMLGLQQILLTLALGLLIGGVTAVILLFTNRRFHPKSSLPYGAFLAGAGIIMLVLDIV